MVEPEGATENATSVRELAVRPSYEELMEAVPHSGFRETMSEVEVEKRAMNRALEAIEENEDLLDEAKERRADDIISRYEPKINEHYANARQKAVTSAESSYLWSLPAPEGKTFATLKASDSSELLAVNSEADGIAARISGTSLQEMTKAASKNPRDKGMQEGSGRREQILREEYDMAMAAGGVEGRVRALAVKKVCERTGVDLERIVDHHRADKHRRALDEARIFEKAAFALPSKPGQIQNPFTAQRARARRIGTYSGATPVMTGGRAQQVFAKKNRKRPWK